MFFVGSWKIKGEPAKAFRTNRDWVIAGSWFGFAVLALFVALPASIWVGGLGALILVCAFGAGAFLTAKCQLSRLRLTEGKPAPKNSDNQEKDDTQPSVPGDA